MTRIRKLVTALASAVLALLFFIARPAFADAHAEAAAKDAVQKAQADYAAMNYAGAVARFTKAVQTCGANRCLPLTKATLLRDLGVMQFRAGDKNGAAKSWADALALQPTIAPNPDYDASDVGAAYEDARASAGLPAGPVSSKPPPSAAGPAGGAPGAARPGGAAAGPGAGAAAGAGAAPAPPAEPVGEQPTGDFAHDPPLEQKEDTPLPIHVEYTGSSKLSRVVLKYKGAQMREWARIDLKRAESGGVWEGVIPCSDVGRGTMRYWVQGFDRTGEPVVASGDPKHPYYVPIRDKITSEPPHLPGKEAPKSCEETDCPPGLPGCKGKKSGDATPSEGAAAAGPGEGGGGAAAGGDEGEGEGKKGQGGYARFWFGLSLTFDFLSLSTASDVCRRGPTGVPINSAGYYCYDSNAGADFPTQATNSNLALAGTTSGGVQLGNVRVLLAFDYALTPNVLAGGRLGYVFNAYRGSDAAKAGHAFPPLHIEGRATYLFGRAPLVHAGFSPMGFFGLGLSEFDGHQATNVTFKNGMAPQVVDAWLTDAPFFLVFGAGARYQFSPRAAVTGALRLNLVIGGNGFMPTYGPEFGVLYGF
jgi:hypothetical protein